METYKKRSSLDPGLPVFICSIFGKWNPVLVNGFYLFYIKSYINYYFYKKINKK